MRMSLDRLRLLTAGGLLLAGTVLIADGTRFSDFTPLATSAGPIPVGDAAEATPMTFGNPLFEQRSIADRAPAGGEQAQLRRLGHDHRE